MLRSHRNVLHTHRKKHTHAFFVTKLEVSQCTLRSKAGRKICNRSITSGPRELFFCLDDHSHGVGFFPGPRKRSHGVICRPQARGGADRSERRDPPPSPLPPSLCTLHTPSVTSQSAGSRDRRHRKDGRRKMGRRDFPRSVFGASLFRVLVMGIVV